MTLRHMRIFSAVYRCGSITKAAEALYLTQPSVSVAIQELEAHYGVRLFERTGRRIVPTESGRTFYGYACHITALFDDVDKQLRNWDTLGVLRIGAIITVGTQILPTLISQFQALLPQLRVEVLVERSSQIEQALLDNSIDLALLEAQPEQSSFISVPFLQDELCAIVPPLFPLAAQTCVTLEQLAQYPLLAREEGSSGRTILDALFSIHQLSVRPLWQSASTQAIVRAVAAGLGVAVLPRLLIERDIQDGTVTALLLDEPIYRNLSVVYHKSKYLSANMQQFIALCKQYGSSQNES